MIKKLSIAGGVAAASVASAASLVPSSGTNLQKEIKPKTEEERKIEQARKERQDFISKSDAAVNELNESSESKSRQLSFLKNSDEEDKWKLMWIYDLWNYYKKNQKYKQEVKTALDYTKEEIQQFEKAYWESQVTKQQGKWDKKIDDSKWLDQANEKSQYWEKFKEICLILTSNGKIDKDKNMNTSNSDDFLCVYAGFHTSQWTEYEKYKKTNPSLGIMEHFWTVAIKPSSS